MYVLEGELSLIVENNCEKVAANEMALIFNDQVHSYHTPGHSKCFVSIFSNDYVRLFHFEMSGKIGKQASFSCEQPVRDYLLNGLLQGRTNSKYELKSYLYAICAEYLKKVPLVERKPLDDDLLHKILNYISERFQDNITLNSLAQFIGYEPHYLSHYFNRSIGMNFRQFINQYRISFARHCIESSNTNITEIAMESGFQTIRNFNRVFKNIIGKSPLEYVKGISKNK